MDLSLKPNKIKLNQIIARRDYKTARAVCVEYLEQHPAKAGLSVQGAKQTHQGYIKSFIYFLDNMHRLEDLYNNGFIVLDDKKIKILADDNSKIPFVNYSNSPISNCPGADSCLTFCYSLNSFRFPAPFTRWAINSIIEQERPEIIHQALIDYKRKRSIKKLIKNQGHLDFRLFADGDFKDLNALYNWMDFLKQHPDIKAYAYSKSWTLFIQAIKERGANYFPDNFILNLSSGGRFHNLKDIMKTFNFVRGEFVSIQIDKLVNPHKMTKAQKQDIRKRAYKMGHKKVFICPGVCGSCTSRGHACGDNKRFNDFTIITPVHK